MSMENSPSTGIPVIISKLTEPSAKFTINKILGFDSEHKVWKVELYNRGAQWPNEHVTYVQQDKFNKKDWVLYDIKQPLEGKSE